MNKYSPAFYRFKLTRLIAQDFKPRMNTILDYLIPDELISKPKPNLLYHIIFCILTNSDVNSNQLVKWIKDQHQQGVPLCCHSASEALDLVNNFLVLEDRCCLAATCKNLLIYCSTPEKMVQEYVEWCSLVYNNDNLKDILLRFYTLEELFKLFVKDIRVLSSSLCEELIEIIKQVHGNDNITPAMTSLATTCMPNHQIPPDLIPLVLQYYTQEDFYSLSQVNFDWLKMYSCDDVLGRVNVFRELRICNAIFTNWKPQSSSWHVWQGITRFTWMVSRQIFNDFHALHMSYFYGNCLVKIESTKCHLNLVKCDLSQLRWVTNLPRQWKFQLFGCNVSDYYHLGWEGLAYYLFHHNYQLEYWHTRGNYNHLYNLTMPAHGLLIDASTLSIATISTLITHGKFEVVVLSDCMFVRVAATEIELPIHYIGFPSRTHLVLKKCKNVYALLSWYHLPQQIKKLTYIQRYGDMAGNDLICLRRLMTRRKFGGIDVREKFAIILYESSVSGQINAESSVLLHQFLEDLVEHWRDIKKIKVWQSIKIGFVIYETFLHNDSQSHEYMLDLMKFDTKSAFTKSCNVFKNLFYHGVAGDPKEPVSKLWRDIISDWCFESFAE